MREVRNTKNKVIRHSATICSIEGNRARVQIERTSACDACEASDGCQRHGTKTLVLDVVDDRVADYNVGDKVYVELTADMGHKAVLLGFGLPLLLFVALLFTLRFVGYADDLAAVLSLMALVVYYIILYVMRERLGRHFVISLLK